MSHPVQNSIFPLPQLGNIWHFPSFVESQAGVTIFQEKALHTPRYVIYCRKGILEFVLFFVVISSNIAPFVFYSNPPKSPHILTSMV